MMNEMKTWVESSFMPWKKSMESYSQKQQMFERKLKTKAHEVKYIVALLMENKHEEAVALWNDLGLEPTLSSVTLDIRNDLLVLSDEQGQSFEVSLGQMIAELQRLLG